MSDNAKLVLTLARYAMVCRRQWDRWSDESAFSRSVAYERSARMAARTLFGRELRLPGDFTR